MKKRNKESMSIFERNRLKRRSFLSYTGAGLATGGLLLVGCNDDDNGGVLNTKLDPPSNLAAMQEEDGSVTLTWEDNSIDENSFQIQRSTQMDSGFVMIAEVDNDVTTYTDSIDNLEAGTTYYYRVAAMRDNELSNFSNVVSSEVANAVVSLGSGDVGILNYAYALEQLEAAFYTQVMANMYSGATDDEQRIIEDLQKHEVAHRDFFEAAISSVADPIPGLEVNFSSVDFADRASVLGTAKVFENLGVAAYNGAGKLIENDDYLVVAGKIVSVEARHAAVISNLINPDSTDFVDTVNAKGLDQEMSPADVLSAASDFIVTEIDASQLPTS